MKLRLIGTEDEFERVFPALERIREENPALFDSWRKPQKGNNPKYAESNHYLMYLELTADNVLMLLGVLPTPRAADPFRTDTVDAPYEDVTHAAERQIEKTAKLLEAVNQSFQRHFGDGTSLIIPPKKS